jgi:folate-dependent phosphoribosylglycinamide formyltransferase PurN
MSVVMLIGSHPRHAYLANRLHEAGRLAGLVVERREAFVPEPPQGLSTEVADLYRHHFDQRDRAEARHFGEQALFPADVPRLEVDRDALNGEAVRAFLAGLPVRLLLSYGVHMLAQETLAASPAVHRWNLHGGLSPWYRGCITHFWPSYLLEPQMTGFTVHQLTDRLDHGPVIHQTGTELVRGDGLHDLACRAVQALAGDLPRLAALADRDEVAATAHTSAGRLWLARDWRPEHLRPVYQQHGDRIVDMCLDGVIAGREPELVRQW